MGKEKSGEHQPFFANEILTERDAEKGLFLSFFAAKQLAERVEQLGKEAQSNGDRIQANEYFLQANDYLGMASAILEVVDRLSDMTEDRIKKTLASISQPQPKP